MEEKVPYSVLRVHGVENMLKKFLILNFSKREILEKIMKGPWMNVVLRMRNQSLMWSHS